MRHKSDITLELKEAYSKVGARTYLHLIGDLRHELESLCQRDSEHGLQFLQSLLDKLTSTDDPLENDPVKLIRNLASEEDIAKGEEFLDTHPLGGIYLGCTYYYRANNAHELGLPVLCWNYIAATRYFLGIALTPNRSGITYRALLNSVNSDGNKVRKETIETIKQQTFKIVEEIYQKRQRDKGALWNSKQSAVQAILPLVQEFAASKGWKQKRKNTNKEEQPEGGLPAIRTVSAWLEEMPNAEKYFPIQKKNNEQDAE